MHVQHRWLTLLVITFLTAIIFLFFYLHLRPVWTPEKDKPKSLTTITTIAAPTVTFVNPKKGASQPKLTIVEFGDYQCESCKDLSAALDVLIRTVPEIQVVWKDMPNDSVHDLATPSAIAARCADNQGKFWEFHDILFDKQIILSNELFPALAQELGLDKEKFSQCFENQETLPLVEKDLEEALALQITAVPTIFIGDERITGSLTAEELLSLVRTKINNQ
ncbi:MAG: thioredoxin domain-containing protein [Candidatus Uhrbacteria bacterium]